MKKSMKRLCLLTSLIIPLFSAVLAQQTSGNIRGQVTDPEGNALPGASVMIKGSTRAVVTNLSGNFEILGVKAGNCTLVVHYMGYKPAETDLQVVSGQTANKNFVLNINSVNLTSVTVSALLEGQQKALNQQRNADNIKQVVSADL
ncbi:MAG TPA: carboxypeptidase-like regulatory domain-containing protein, partial [Puia sp.]